MMIENNAEEVAKSIEAFEIQLKSKLEKMVAGFAGDVAYQASIATPRATEEYVATHQELYEARFREHGIPAEAGFHQGSWQYGERGLTLKLEPEINSTSEVEFQARTKAEVSYNLGDTFYIGSESPNMDYLNKRDGIEEKVTDAAARAAYASNLQLHFNRGF
ncbi:MAG: hypothetical protein ACRDBG_16535 [Waterburya sp.]